MRKPTICICDNKDADQLRSNYKADQGLCFRYTGSTIPLLAKSKISSLYPSSVTLEAGLCWTWSDTQIVGFLAHRLICCHLCRKTYLHSQHFLEDLFQNVSDLHDISNYVFPSRHLRLSYLFTLTGIRFHFLD